MKGEELFDIGGQGFHADLCPSLSGPDNLNGLNGVLPVSLRPLLN